MNLAQRLMAGVAGWVGLSASVAGTIDDPRWWGGQVIAQSAAGQVVTSESGQQLDVVQSVLERLSGSVSTLPLKVFEKMPDGSKREAFEHPLYKILHSRPNARQTAQEFFDEAQRHLSWWRNAYSIIHPAADGGPVGELEQIHPSRKVRIDRGSDGFLYYTFRQLPPAIGQFTVRQDKVWHVRKAPLTDDGLEGKPVWLTARETLGKAQAVEQFGALYFANGGSGGGIIEHPGTFKSRDEEADFMRSWREGGTGPNRHRDRMLKYGLKYTAGNVRNDEAQFLETLKEVAVKLCRLWNMPPHLVGILDKATFSNIEQQSIEYVVHTLAPWIVAWEQAASRDLLVGEDQDRFFVEFNVAGLLRGDFKTRWQAYAWGRQWGWLSVNDIRRLENMDPIGPEGDAYMAPLNMVPAGQAKGPNDSPEPETREPEHA